MTRQSVLKSAAIALAFATCMSVAGIASAQGYDPEVSSGVRSAQAQAQAMKAQAMKAQAMKAQAAKARAMQAQAAKMQMMQARQAQAGMAAVTAATLAATDAGECSPYLAKWMMSRNPAWKMAYDACMDD